MAIKDHNKPSKLSGSSLSSVSSLAGLVNNPDANGRRVLTVPVNKVKAKSQVRKVFNDIDELAQSLKSEGQQSPIIVSPADKEGNYVIQKGERRWRAVQAAGIETIDIIINDKNQTELDEVVGELVENIQRDALKSIEIAVALNKLVEAQWDQQAIATRIGKSKTYVSRHLSLIELPESVSRLTDNGVTYDADILNYLRQAHDRDPDAVKVFCEEAVSQGSVTRKDAKSFYDSLRYSGVKKPAQKPIADDVDPESPEGQAALAASTVDRPSGAWVPASPNEVSIRVNVVGDIDTKTGTLLLDRLSNDETRAWVRVDDGGRGKLTLVSLNNIELVTMGKTG